MSKVLKKEFAVFEFGTGGSSLYYSSRVARVECVEHDMDWYNLVLNHIKYNKIKNVFCELKIPQKSIDSDETYKSVVFKEIYPNLSFEEYCKYIDSFPDSHFDLIAIDGRARVGSLKHSLSKIKPTGLILIDNSERVEYNAIRFALVKAGWVEKTFKGPGPYSEKFWQTSIWNR
ncbi:hypothetical protein [Shiella aurantiaca]|uniref:hypothetical protein n=1 Tax=Shiella aurantiaca TaxID=3058365 RepID=UPI0029F4EBCA|nr:hypothetical protein [Shiella aurantiaca]